ncbi:MAG: hypothetical protein C0505_14410 [Leptothrix sp. (in: Bacteria)]|nr:hypothetical protein [Leptothrix sp. (in: b-proteobacteria)]
MAEVSALLEVSPMRNELRRWLMAAGGGLPLLALLLGGALARRIGTPLTTLAARIARRAPDARPGDLARDLVHDEGGELARHLDHWHARTCDLLAREQAFTADASHELRTPLTVPGLAADRLRTPATAEQRPLVRSIPAAGWRLQQTIDLLLAPARKAPTDATTAPERPLLPTLEQRELAHAPLLDREGVEVDLQVPVSLTRHGSPALTQRLVGMSANAIAHTQAPRVVIETDATELRLSHSSRPPAAALRGADAAGRARGVKGADSTAQGRGLFILRRLAERRRLALELRPCDGQTNAIVRSAGAAAQAGLRA